VPPLKTSWPKFQKSPLPLEGKGRRPEPWLLQIRLTYLFIHISDAPFIWIIFFVHMICGVCLFCSYVKDATFRLLCLRGANPAESIPQE
jgi:hypothetical protein